MVVFGELAKIPCPCQRECLRLQLPGTLYAAVVPIQLLVCAAAPSGVTHVPASAAASSLILRDRNAQRDRTSID